MSVFMLDCDPVISGANTINSLANQISSVVDSISSYDTSCEDGFDFTSVKAQMIANVEACVTKFKNTSIYADNVVSAHTSLQKSLTLAKTETNKNTNNSTGDSSSSSSSEGYSGSYYPESSVSAISGGVTAGIASAISGLDETNTELENKENENVIIDKIEEVNHVGINLDKLDDSLKNDYINKVTYNGNGYAMIDDHYVVLCNESIGTVGDEIIFKNNNGEEVKCIVGISFEKPTTDNTKSNVSFIVNENWNSENENNINIDMTKCTVTNNGQFDPNANKNANESTILTNLASSTDNQSSENETIEI